MADWPTIASTATAAGTLVLAIATFSSVRASQQAARIAERALLVGMRPVLAPSRPGDPTEKVTFVDGYKMLVDGGVAGVEDSGEAIYFVMPLRNVGTGMAVLHGWHYVDGGPRTPHAEPQDFRLQSIDLLVPPGDTGLWQAAIRDQSDPFGPVVREAMVSGERLVVDLLYGDQEGSQLTVSRFGMTRIANQDGRWFPRVTRHWSLEGRTPRPLPDGLA
jgi:hypothetical protein